MGNSMRLNFKYGFALVGLFSSLSAIAGTIPDCVDRGVALPLNNEQVLQWKTSTQNQFLGRARVQGQILAVYPDHSGHHHFEIQLGNAKTDTLEVVFNESFGATPALHSGMQVEACGDYITSIAPAGRYPASPDGAIMHWVHASPNPTSHPSGYLVIDGTLYGQDTANAGPSHGHGHGHGHGNGNGNGN
jgi:hypothetical protein